jgi:nitrate/nitrite transporter NarK
MAFSDFLRLLVATPTLLLLMAAFCLANFVAMVLLSWMPKFLYDRFHMGLAVAGLAATVFVQVASMVGSPLGGWMADALRRRFAGGRILVQLVGLARRRVLRDLVRADLVGLFTGHGSHRLGPFQGHVRRQHFRLRPRRDPPRSPGATVGLMNTTGWLVGAGTAPIFIGAVAQRAAWEWPYPWPRGGPAAGGPRSWQSRLLAPV